MKYTIEDIRSQMLSVSEALEDIAADVNEIRQNLLTATAGENKKTNGETGNIHGFQAAIDLLHEDKLNVGNIVEMEADDGKIIEWRVLHIHADYDGETMAVLQTCKVIDYSLFDEPTKQHPYGSNDYNASTVCKKLDHMYFNNCHDATLVTPRWIDGQYHDFWLLSVDEVGAGDGNQAYVWYSPEDLVEDELAERRSLEDTDGDPANWWLRTPSAASAINARSVYTTGALGSIHADNARGVAPACYIR